MTMPTLRLLILLALAAGWSLAPGAAHAQQGGERETTEQRLKDLKNQIEADQSRLDQTRREEQATMATLEGLNRQIALREALVRNYRIRMDEIRRESDSLRSSLVGLEEDLDDLQDEYHKRAIHAYRYGRMHDLALILAAESINQMLIRIRYLHRFAERRRSRLDHIVETTENLASRRESLTQMLEQNQELLAQAEAEQRTLARLQQDRAQVVSNLRARRSTIESEIKEKQRAVSELETRVRRLIAEEKTRRDRARTASERADMAQLSGSFQRNRGRLPWPAQGVVVEPFGETVNPVLGTKTPNPGMVIATQPSAEVRSVFAGEVLSVDVMPDYGTYVIVQHGDFLTVYANFSLLYVGRGSKVEAGQVIGRAGTASEPKGEGLFFGVFEGAEPVDPARWLGNR